MSDETAILPETEAPPPYEPPPAPPILVESLATLDKDFTGEAQFARLAVSSLKSFAARHASDLAVRDAYSDAIRTLELLPGVLAAAQDRAAGEITRKVLSSEAERLSAAQAAAEREHAMQWAASAPPVLTQGQAPPPVVEPPPPPPEEGL